MIYTIGRTENYERYFQEQAPEGPKKKGRTSDYTGGAVWKTYEEALRSCPQGYSVYGVEADWEKDTEACNSNYNELLRDARLIQLQKA